MILNQDTNDHVKYKTYVRGQIILYKLEPIFRPPPQKKILQTK